MAVVLLREAIENLVRAFDEGLGEDMSGPAHLLRFEVREDGVDFGVKALAAGQHPLDELLGLVAPDEWHALGTVSHGWATKFTNQRPSRAADRERIRAVHVCGRDGTEVGGYRMATGELELQDTPAVGTIPDALRRAVGLPTPPPEFPPAEVTAADWLDAVADNAALVREPPVPYSDWEDVRWDVITRKRIGNMTATDAAWMDTGMFARWMAATYPRPADHLAAVRRVVDGKVYKVLRQTLRDWDVLP